MPGVRGKISTFRFDKETLDRAGMGDAGGGGITPPFLVRACVRVCVRACVRGAGLRVRPCGRCRCLEPVCSCAAVSRFKFTPSRIFATPARSSPAMTSAMR
jgi:hypothetical protein